MPRDPYEYFRVEAREILEGLGRGVLQLEQRGAREGREGDDGRGAADRAEVVSSLLRLAHTLKGAARVVKRPAIAERAHAIEEALGPLRQPGAQVERGLVDGLLALVDGIAAEVASLDAPAVAAAPPAGPAGSNGAHASNGAGSATSNAAPAQATTPAPATATATATATADGGLAAELAPSLALRADAAEVDALIEGVTEVGVQLRALRRAAGALARARHLVDMMAEQVAAARAAGLDGGRNGNNGAGGGPGSNGAAASLPSMGVAAGYGVKTGGGGLATVKLRSYTDDLRGVIGRLEREVNLTVEQAERETQQVRDTAERLRLAPSGALFTALERTTRDVANALGKQATFTGDDHGVRLDAQVLAVVQGALVQMVRNALAHGIEAPAERVRAGKPPAGRVEVEVARRGGRVAFVCRDDGRGIDVDAVRRVAVERKLLAPAAAQAMAGAEVLRLLLKGGLTTSGSVSELAGRGIGLDVVRDAAARLGGEVTAHTEVGRGTTIELVVPPTLSSLDVLLVEVGGLAAAIPLGAIQRTVRLQPGDVVRAGGGDTVVVDGTVLPFVPLGRALRDRGAAESRGGALSAAVVDGGGARAALGIDRLRGAANVVVRPLPALAPADAMVAGAALDADGTPQLVLDPVALVAAALRAGGPEVAAAATAAAHNVLVIDDSLTTRMLEQSILESAGYTVELATSAEEGLEKAKRGGHHLFLVDVEMPGMDGFSFVEKTRADPQLRVVPAIMVTSRNAPADRRRAEEAGAGGYIVKGDFDQVELLSTIRRLVGERQQQP